MIQITRDFDYSTGDAVALRVIANGVRRKFLYPDRRTGFKHFKKLLRDGAEYLSFAEEDAPWRWANVRGEVYL